jgi:nanoRNase/pAp phosphatase (c-di-AMP/oligoRNAs hydrolase)
MMQSKQYRLLTRSDFDGLVCAMILKEMNMLGEIQFVHPKDVQDGIVNITETDILTNLPYDSRCFLCFDHHASEKLRNEGYVPENWILDVDAKSAARVVYNFFGGASKFPRITGEMMAAVDKADAAQFDRNDILNPEAWVLLSFLMDPRTGLGRFRDFRISNYQLMEDLIDFCLEHTIDEVLNLPDVKERIDIYNLHTPLAIEQIRKCTKMHAKIAVLDLREQDLIHPTNRFLIYALYPESNLSITAIWGVNRQNTVFAIGKSILDRSSPVNVGQLALQFGGGGHASAGTCQIPNDQSDTALNELIAQINTSQATQKPAYAN